MRLNYLRPTRGWAVAIGVAAIATLGVAIHFAVNLASGLPDAAAMARIGETDQATTVLDASDALAFTIYKEQRTDVPLAGMSPHLIHAIVTIEDQRFYGHFGFDPRRIAAVAVSNVWHRRAAQGASTITQQLARLSFLKPEKTFRRKAQELVLALRIESRYEKGLSRAAAETQEHVPLHRRAQRGNSGPEARLRE